MYEDLAPALLVESDGPVRIVTLNKPEQMNAFSDDLHRAMWHVWLRLIDDEEAGAVVLTGAGRAFSTGGYLPNFARDNVDPVWRRRDVRQAERIALAMIDCELPVVAAVNGPAIGLGCSLALLSDLVVMADTAYFADPHVSVGLVAGDGGAFALPLVVGMLRAKEFVLLGDRIPADACERLGLANRVVGADDVLPTATALAHRLAAQPKQALRDSKRAMNQQLRQAATLVLSFALAAESESFATDDVRRKVEEFTARSRD